MSLRGEFTLVNPWHSYFRQWWNAKVTNSLVYSESEIERIAHMAFQIAMKRSKRVCSVDKSNVLEVMELWREVVTAVAVDYPEVRCNICMWIMPPCNWPAIQINSM